MFYEIFYTDFIRYKGGNKMEKEKKPIYKRWWFWVIVIIVVIGVGGSSSNKNTDNTVQVNAGTSGQTDNTQEPIEYTVVDIDTMEEALKNNAAAAKDTYNGKYFEITGKLSTIDSDLKYISLCSMTNDFDLTGVQCYIKNDEQKEIVKTLSRDDVIVVKGKVKGVGEVLGYSLDITEISKQQKLDRVEDLLGQMFLF